MESPKLRSPKNTDQEDVEKAFNILKDILNSHPRIEPTLWASAFWSCLVDGYNNSGFTYEQFCLEWENVKDNYKGWFDQ
jgi:hypothetical protein